MPRKTKTVEAEVPTVTQAFIDGTLVEVRTDDLACFPESFTGEPEYLNAYAQYSSMLRGDKRMIPVVIDNGFKLLIMAWVPA